ncbi:hypothetical protein NC651_003292 [Populus alba x Populus x berolinensis]|nr:hypothetical protein NC651_003292 [Populus alba x Populus x berolinensis]
MITILKPLLAAGSSDRRRHPGFAICPFEILLKVEQVQWRRMNTIRIFNNTAMLAGEVAIVDDCRYLIKSTSAYGSRSRIKVTAITEMKLYEISRTIHDSLGSPQKLCNR